MNINDFNYELPVTQIAQRPLDKRDESRLLVLDRRSGRLEHRRFRDLPDLLRPSDLLVVNESRVIAARLIPESHAWGIEEAEFSWVLESNRLSYGTLQRGGAKITKRYRLFDSVATPPALGAAASS